MSDQITQIALNIKSGRETDIQELAVLTEKLRNELMDLKVEAVDFVSAGKAPQRAKAGDPVTLGTLLLTIVASGGLLTTLINALQSWLTRHERSSITLEIDGDKLQVTGRLTKQKQPLVDAWIKRHQQT